MSNTFQIWHGSRRWDGNPEVRPAKRGRAEWGAGIYGSTHFLTASSYAQGGGKVQLLTIQQTRLLEKSCLPLSAVTDFIKRYIPRNLRSLMLEDCENNAERMRNKVLNICDPVGTGNADTTWIEADVLRNLMVNYEVISGVKGVTLANFYAEQGIGLSLDIGGMKPGEHWLVVYDPQLIVSWQSHTYETALEIGHELPTPKPHTTEPVAYLRPMSRYSSICYDR